MKNNTVMIENGPRYVWPLLDGEDGAVVVVIIAIDVLSWFMFEKGASAKKQSSA
jgi:hypothetical protein